MFSDGPKGITWIVGSLGCSPALTDCGFEAWVENRDLFEGKLFGGGMKVNANVW